MWHLHPESSARFLNFSWVGLCSYPELHPPPYSTIRLVPDYVLIGNWLVLLSTVMTIYSDSHEIHKSTMLEKLKILLKSGGTRNYHCVTKVQSQGFFSHSPVPDRWFYQLFGWSKGQGRIIGCLVSYSEKQIQIACPKTGDRILHQLCHSLQINVGTVRHGRFLPDPLQFVIQ